MDADKIPGIGPKTKQRLMELQVNTIGDLGKFDLFRLIEEFGKKTATYMHNAARGIDDETLVESRGKLQIGRIVTLKKDAKVSAEMYHDLYKICQSVVQNAIERKLTFKTVGIMLILDNLENVTRSKSLKVHTNNFDLLHSTARSVLDEAMAPADRKVRRLGVRLFDLQDNAGQNTILDFMGAGG
jgi:nucleotidyltransferase/DNA polymerase involved in DNA repair